MTETRITTIEHYPVGSSAKRMRVLAEDCKYACFNSGCAAPSDDLLLRAALALDALTSRHKVPTWTAVLHIAGSFVPQIDEARPEMIRHALRQTLANPFPVSEPQNAESPKGCTNAQDPLRGMISRLVNALSELGHTHECYSGELKECDCPLQIINEAMLLLEGP